MRWQRTCRNFIADCACHGCDDEKSIGLLDEVLGDLIACRIAITEAGEVDDDCAASE